MLSEQQRGRPEWTKGSVHEHTVLFLASVSVPSVFKHLVRTAEGTILGTAASREDTPATFSRT